MWRSQVVCDTHPNVVLFPSVLGAEITSVSNTNPMMKCLAWTKGVFFTLLWVVFFCFFSMSQWKGRGGIERLGRKVFCVCTHTSPHMNTHLVIITLRGNMSFPSVCTTSACLCSSQTQHGPVSVTIRRSLTRTCTHGPEWSAKVEFIAKAPDQMLRHS